MERRSLPFSPQPPHENVLVVVMSGTLASACVLLAEQGPIACPPSRLIQDSEQLWAFRCWFSASLFFFFWL